MNSFDLLIVGSGPAGSTLAYHAAKAGLHTCILEKETLPRYKTCGGVVEAKVLKLLPHPIDEVTERKVFGMQMSSGLRRPFTRYWHEPLIYMTMRDKFDYLLVKWALAAGAELVEEARVTALEQQAEQVVLSTSRGEFSAKIVAGAD